LTLALLILNNINCADPSIPRPSLTMRSKMILATPVVRMANLPVTDEIICPTALDIARSISNDGTLDLSRRTRTIFNDFFPVINDRINGHRDNVTVTYVVGDVNYNVTWDAFTTENLLIKKGYIYNGPGRAHLQGFQLLIEIESHDDHDDA